jgi:hypothetical protein
MTDNLNKEVEENKKKINVSAGNVNKDLLISEETAPQEALSKL